MNQRLFAYQTNTLPLSYKCTKAVGLEPTMLILKTSVLPLNYTFYFFPWWGNRTLINGLKVRCIATMLTEILFIFNIEMEMMGLEPIPFVCKTNILPVILHSFFLILKIIGRGGIWTHELKSQDLASLHNNHSVTRIANSLLYSS